MLPNPSNNAPSSLLGITPEQTQSLYDQGMVKDIIKENPGLGRTFTDSNFEVHNPTEARLKSPVHEGNYSEFYQKGEAGGYPDMLPNPGSPDKMNLEFYHPDAIGNSSVRKSLTMGEMFHGLHEDPTWQNLRGQFVAGFTPEVLNQYKGMSPEEFNAQIPDQYIRASFFQNPKSELGLHPPAYAAPEDYYNNNEFLPQYSPEQHKVMDLMKQYIQNGTVQQPVPQNRV